jgi:ribosomal protein L20
MPRSVNSVAKEQEEKIMKLAKGYFVDVKRLDSS